MSDWFFELLGRIVVAILNEKQICMQIPSLTAKLSPQTHTHEPILDIHTYMIL